MNDLLSLSHAVWDVPYHMDPEVPKKGTVWRAEETPWRNVQRVSAAKGEHGARRAFDGGPCLMLSST